MWRMIIFGVVATLIWTGVHLYIGNRLITRIGLRNPQRRIAWGVLALHGLMVPITSILRRAGIIGPFDETMTLVTYVGMGFTATFVLTLLALDAVTLAGRLGRRFSRPPSEPDPDRRNLLAGSFNFGAFAFAGVSTGVGYSRATTVPEVKEVEVPIANLPEALDGFTIAQLSDTHIGPTLKRDFLEAVVERTNALNADLIAITGDLVDGYVKDLADEVASIANLSARRGVYYVTGNHEYYWNGPEWAEFVASTGIRVLLNEHELVEVDGAKLLVGGVTDYRAERHVDAHKTDPHKAISGAPAHDFSLLLAHQPTSIYEAQKAGWKMQISGHTHGGQFFPWTLVVGLYHEFSAGLDRLQDTWIYVSRGVGFWGPPNRFGTSNEITHITLRRG